MKVVKKEKKCELCKQKTGIYKCPKCLTQFCSLICFKSHKKQEICDKIAQSLNSNSNKEKQNENALDVLFKTYDTIPISKLRLLKNDRRINDILQNKHLRKAILEIYQSTKPNNMIEKFMKCKLFNEFVDICLSIVDNENRIY